MDRKGPNTIFIGDIIPGNLGNIQKLKLSRGCRTQVMGRTERTRAFHPLLRLKLRYSIYLFISFLETCLIYVLKVMNKLEMGPTEDEIKRRQLIEM